MHMLRHDDVTENKKDVPPTDRFKGVFKRGADCLVRQVWKTLVTTEGEEMQITCLLEALKLGGHVSAV